MVKAGPWRAVRMTVTVVCVIAVVVSFVAVLRQLLAATAADAAVVTAERQGVVYLHPLTGLIGQLVEAQSAAVNGEKVEVDAVRKSLSGVGRADVVVGPALGTQQRYIDLRDKIQAVLDGGLTGRPAYQSYSDIMLLTTDLARRVGDSSNLVRDPDLDSYYLMKAALEQLPIAMINAGRAADLVALTGRGGDLAGETAVQIAVARYGVADAAERVSAGLLKSVDATLSDALGKEITPQLDAFRAAADVFAPSTMLAQLADNVDGRVLAAASHEVFATALPLAHKLLSELDKVLTIRQKALADQRGSTIWAAVAAALVAFVMFWTLVLGRRHQTARDARPGEGAGRPGSVADGLALGTLSDLRRLLDDDLVGPGTRGKGRRGPDDAR
jgi:hypothetical protein